MNKVSAADKVDRRFLKEAAGWYAVLADEGESFALREQWLAWLAASSAHREAWAQIESVASRFDRLRDDGAEGQSVASETLHNLQGRRLTRRTTLKSLLVLAGVGGSAWLSLPELGYLHAADFVSARGEIKELVLSDGSKAWLNTSSHMDVNYTAEERLIHLLEGDIFIDTAPDSARPLIVETRHGRLRALGTRFSVAEERGGSVLAVFDGRVEVDIGAGKTRIVGAGEQLAFSRAGWAADLQPADPARQAWIKHVLLAKDLPLGDVLAQLERYRFGYIDVEPSVAHIRVMGVFPLDDPDVVLEMLSASLGVVVDTRIPWWVRVRESH